MNTATQISLHRTANDRAVEWRTRPGLLPYAEAVSDMETRVAEIRDGHADELVWLVEHPPLYTAGTSAQAEDLLTPDRFPVYQTGRGGQYTYHGPGQRVAYAPDGPCGHVGRICAPTCAAWKPG